MYATELLSETYVAVDAQDNLIAYFSILNDKIERNYTESKIWNRLSRIIPNTKRRSSYPALKIGRFAVAKQYQSSGIGSELIGYILKWTVQQKRTGCRFVTVDALNNAVQFYIKNDFFVIHSPIENEITTAMCFDLKSIITND